MRRHLAKSGIQVNKAPCVANNNTNCTDVGGLQPEVVDYLTVLSQEYNRDASAPSRRVIFITGGNEHAHTCNPLGRDHCSGYKVDIGASRNGDFYDWLEENGTLTDLRRRRAGDNASLYEHRFEVNGRRMAACWARENAGQPNDHWDIKLGNC